MRCLATEIWAFGTLSGNEALTETFLKLSDRTTDVLVRGVAAGFMLRWLGSDAPEMLARRVADALSRTGDGEDTRVWFASFLEESLQSCPIGGQLLQQIQSGRYTS